MDMTGFSWSIEAIFIVIGALAATISVEMLSVIGTLAVLALAVLVYPGYIAWG